MNPGVRLRTAYSFKTAVGSLDEALDHIAGCQVAPITDRGSTFGWNRWRRLCEGRGIHAALGVELGVSPDPAAKRPLVDHWIFFPVGGTAALNRLVEKATQQFRYEPLLDYRQALEAEDVVRIVGRKARPRWLADIPHPSTTYYALSPSMTPGHVRRMDDLGLAPAAAGDNVYPGPDDQGRYEIACGRNASVNTWPQHILTGDEWRESVAFLGCGEDTLDAAQANAATVLLKGTATEMPSARLPEPPEAGTLRELCLAGAERLGEELGERTVECMGRTKRLERELGVIEGKGFENYFLIVADLCRWARGRMAVGPGRGSSCGSYVCYLLGITLVDPLKHGLLFERFVDPSRADLPDIDIDFPDNRRDEVIEWISERYGAENVARLGTVNNFRPLSAIKETAAALQIPMGEAERVIASLPETLPGDARADLSIEDTLNGTPAGKDVAERFPGIRAAALLEGQPRHSGQHASGVVLSQSPVREICPVDARSGSVMIDMKDAEEYGFLKVDVLGLTQLAAIEEALQSAGKDLAWLASRPLEDEKALDVLNARKFSGVFQYSGNAVRSLAAEVDFRNFSDVVAVPALARPGPLASGAAMQWVARSMMEDREMVKRLAGPEAIWPYIAGTDGVIVYQEQVMNIVRRVGRFSDEDVSAVRKAMAKTRGTEEIDRYGEAWKKAAVAGYHSTADLAERIVEPMTEREAEKVWSDMTGFGRYAFNKSHAVAYGMISYWCCYLKAHFPLEYAAAALNHETDMDKCRDLLRELWADGRRYTALDPERSTDKWIVADGDLVGPLQLAAGVGPKTVETILGARARNEKLSERTLARLKEAKTPLDSLWPIHDARVRICLDLAARNITSEPTAVEKIPVEHHSGEPVLVIGVPEDVAVRDENEAQRVARRGNRIEDGSPTSFLSLKVRDDTGRIAAKVPRHNFAKAGEEIVRRKRPGNALYAFKGEFLKIEDHAMLMVERVRYLGDVEND